MSTALVSSSAFGDFRDILFKSNSLTSKSHMKNMIVDRKAVGAPLVHAITSSASVRRNSGTSASLISPSSAFNFSSNKLNNSMLSLNETTTTNATTITTNNNTNNLLNSTNCLQQTGHRKLDRSFSEPVNSAVGLLGINLGSSATNVVGSSSQLQQQQQQQQNQGNSSRYKTELCRPFEESGTCKYGDKCQFAHGGHELRTLARHPKYKTELCRTFHTTGLCPYGPRCHFIHNDDESRKNSTSSTCSSCSSSSSSSSGTLSPPPIIMPTGPRPKALSVGSFSLGSSSDSSPPSSLSESPTNSIGSFFEDTFLNNFPATSNSQPATPTANNAFTYSTQDFTSALIANNRASNFNNNNNTNNKLAAQQQLFNRALNQMNLSNALNQRNVNNFEAILVDSGVGSNGSAVLGARFTTTSLRNDRLTPPEVPESPTEEELDNLSGNFDISRSLRLPIFHQLSVCDD